MNLPIMPSGMETFLLNFLCILIAIGITLFLCVSKFKNHKNKKRLIIFFFSLLIFIVIYIVAFLVSNIIGQDQVYKQFAKMSTKGIPTYINSIAPVIPKEKSDNAIYFYEAAKSLIPYQTSSQIFKLSTPYTSPFDIAEWKEEDRKTALQLLADKEIDLIFGLFHQGAEKSLAVYQRDYTKGFEILLPELSTQRSLFWLLQMKSSALGLDGKTSEGYALIYDGLRLVKQLESDPILIAQLVNLACISIDIDTMNFLLEHNGIDDKAAKHLLSILEQIDINRSILRAVDGDRLLTELVFEWFIKGDTRLENFMSTFTYKCYLFKPGMKIVASFFFYWDYNYFLTYMLKIRGLFSEPYWKVADKIKELDIEHKNIPLYYPISKTIMPALSQTKVKTAKTESEIACAKVKLALHIYKNEHGEFPEKLEQLSKILTVIPVDPMTGNALSYSKDGTSFKLSCTWLDEKAKKAIKK